MAMSKKYKYIAICATKFDKKKFDELTQNIDIRVLIDTELYFTSSDSDCFVYSLATKTVTDSYVKYLNNRFKAHIVDSVEDFASYILAHKLGASLEELFNE